MKRFLTGTIFALLLIATILLRDVSLAFFDAFIGVAMVLATMEMSNAIEKRSMKNIKYLAMLYPVVMYLIYLLGIRNSYSVGKIALWQSLLLLSIFMLALIGYFIYVLIIKRKKQIKIKEVTINALKVALNTALICIYPALLMGLMFVINHIQEFAGVISVEANVGLLLLTLLFVITFVTDIFAFFVGSTFGGAKLCPLVSPKKTISGAIGGIFFTVLAITLSFYLFNSIDLYYELFTNYNVNILTFVLLAIIGSIISQLGDLLASFIKRKCGIPIDKSP